jgi:hypothetical protein
LTVTGPANNPPNDATLIAPVSGTCINASNPNPIFQARVSDPDGDNVYAWFGVSGYGGWNGNTVSSGNISQLEWFNLPDYDWWWSAYAIDTSGATSANWATNGWWLIRKDTVAPVPTLDQSNGCLNNGATSIDVILGASDPNRAPLGQPVISGTGVVEGDVDVRINGGVWVNTGLPNNGNTMTSFVYTGALGQR